MKDELYKKDEIIAGLFNSSHSDMKEILEHVTGMNRVVDTNKDGNIHSIQRNRGIQTRIARAEAKDRQEAEPLIAQRKREYNERIDALLGGKPETVLEDLKEDAVPKNGTESI